LIGRFFYVWVSIIFLLIEAYEMHAYIIEPKNIPIGFDFRFDPDPGLVAG